MYMRIIWGRIVAGQWDGFEAAYKKATSLRGNVKGLKNQWLARDQGVSEARVAPCGLKVGMAAGATSSTCAGAPPPARTDADPLPRIWRSSARDGRRRYFVTVTVMFS